MSRNPEYYSSVGLAVEKRFCPNPNELGLYAFVPYDRANEHELPCNDPSPKDEGASSNVGAPLVSARGCYTQRKEDLCPRKIPLKPGEVEPKV